MSRIRWEPLPAGYLTPGKPTPPTCDHAVKTAARWMADCDKPATHGGRFPDRAAAAAHRYDLYACDEHTTREATP